MQNSVSVQYRFHYKIEKVPNGMLEFGMICFPASLRFYDFSHFHQLSISILKILKLYKIQNK